MESRRSKYIRIYTPKFTADKKAMMLAKTKTIIEQLPKVSQTVSRLEMRANRIYLYAFVERRRQEDKYVEYPYARITLQDDKGDNCIVDWQRHNDRWMTLPYNGSLAQCLRDIEKDNCWF